MNIFTPYLYRKMALHHWTPEERFEFFNYHFNNLPSKLAPMMIWDETRTFDGDDVNNVCFNYWNRCWGSYNSIIKLEEFADLWRDREFNNFIYHRQSGMVFTQLEPLDHFNMMAILYTLTKANNNPDLEFPKYSQNSEFYLWLADNDSQDNYLKDGMGLYKSSASASLTRHKKFQMTAVEYDAFRGVQQGVLDY